MHQVGITTKGDLVVAGLYVLKGTYGLPLIHIIDYLQKYNIIVSIKHWILEGLQAGSKFDTLKAEVEESLRIKYGKNFATIV